VAVRVFPGNTADPTAFTTIVDAVRDTFKLTDMVMVGDRGMITSARVEALREKGVSILVLLEAGDHEMLWPGVARTPKSPAGQ
jgi:transposase